MSEAFAGRPILTKEITLRGGRTQQIQYFGPRETTVEPVPTVESIPIDPELVRESLVVAFAWLLSAEELDEEDRGIEIGNLFSYALAEGLELEQVDALFKKVLEEEN